MAPAAPLPRRLLAPDALRGLAVIGMALVIVHAYALPGPAYHNPLAYGADGRADFRVWLASFVFLEGKFRAIFAPWGLGLFGAVTRWQAFALALVPIIAMLAWSPPWAKGAGLGPCERFWRAAARALS